MATPLPARRKLVIVGDGACGKTTLLLVFARGTFTEVHVPTVFESSVADIQLADGRWVELSLWDTAGQEDYDRLRPLCYPDTRVLLLCFALDDRDSFENVEEKWLPEITHYIPTVPRILVGCKSDLADTPAQPQHPTSSASSPSTSPPVLPSSAHADTPPKPRGRAVSRMEAEAAARAAHALAYVECSAKTGAGVHDVFLRAATAAMSGAPGGRRSRVCFVL